MQTDLSGSHLPGNVPHPTMSGKLYYLVIDFEATCWEEEERRGDQEMIEWGALVCDVKTGEIRDEFRTFVRPTRYPELSGYCTALTGISQRDVDTAPTFPWALGMAVDWMGDPSNYIFCSWGEFDRYLLRASCRYHRVPYPFDEEYIDLKPIFQENHSGRPVDMRRALDMIGVEHTGRLHRALDDARNVAAILKVMIADRMLLR